MATTNFATGRPFTLNHSIVAADGTSLINIGSPPVQDFVILAIVTANTDTIAHDISFGYNVSSQYYPFTEQQLPLSTNAGHILVKPSDALADGGPASVTAVPLPAGTQIQAVVFQAVTSTNNIYVSVLCQFKT